MNNKIKSKFDEVISRKGTSSTKWDLVSINGYPEDTLAMWTADMDFEVIPEITEALQNRISHPIYGYSMTIEGQNEAVCNWMKRRHQWEPNPEWIINTPGIVSAFKMAVQALTKTGEAVLIQTPVYYPFTDAIVDNNRQLIMNPLVFVNGHYEIDFQDFESKIVENEVKMFILCNPHNPVGRVFTREELERMGDICLKHNVLVISDEVHGDFVYGKNKHIPFLTIKDDYKEITIVCTGASKTFNLAGFKFSNIFVPNPQLRQKYFKHLDACGIATCNTFGSIVTKAAYENGDQWVDELVDYIYGNILFFKEYLAQELPMLKVIEPEGTYLVWVDFSSFNFSDEELTNFMLYDAHVWLDEGYIFGTTGKNFERFNLAYPRSIIKEAVDRIKGAAIKKGII